jgi:hypothetical protein
MKNKKTLRLKIRKTVKACKGKRGCYWDGEPVGITKLKIAA